MCSFHFCTKRSFADVKFSQMYYLYFPVFVSTQSLNDRLSPYALQC